MEGNGTDQSVAPLLDVVGSYEFSETRAHPVSDRSRVHVSGVDEDETRQALSSEEIERMCVGVPPFVATFVHYYYELCPRFDFPSWYDPRTLKDSEKRTPADPDYDVSSVWIPRKGGKVVEEGHSTPMLQQYWEIKESHFNEIILFKVGKFYELFYMDAAIAQPVCQLKWMGHDRRAHVGFPEVSLDHHAALLIAQGYTVCVVEQTETVNEANERSAQAGRKSSGALVERKICQVFTNGTLVHEDMLSKAGSTAHYLCSVVGCDGRLAVVLVDCATGQFQVGILPNLAALRTVLFRFQPKEVLISGKEVGGELGKILAANFGGSLVRWTQWEGRGLPDSLAVEPEIRSLVNSHKPLTVAVNGTVNYLSHLLLHESVTLCSVWSLLTGDSSPVLVMDATVLSHLEILKDSENSNRGSLLQFMDRTSTPFGSRQMKVWVCGPLAEEEPIQARLDCVEFFHANNSLRKKLGDKLAALPDLERGLQRLCAQAMQVARSAVFFNEMENKRIGGFLAFLDSVVDAVNVFEFLKSLPNLPALLTSLVTDDTTDLPTICSNLKNRVKKRLSDGTFEPQPGAYAEYDSGVAEIAHIDSQLNEELKTVRSKLKDAQYVTVKYKNEIEVGAASELPGSAEITSSRKGFVRFQTAAVRELVARRDAAEQKLKDLLYPFMATLFAAVNEHRVVFASLVARVAHVDCLLALARIGNQPGWVRPVFGGNEGSSTISLSQSRHPIQEHLLLASGGEFVPNDISLQQSVLLVTGANMGGKSTILRQVCLNVILAQMGSFVPAASCRISKPVDRIFTRIGASDNILEGKSTFLTELEETAVLLREGTERSLAVIDELGRGTSTFDGVAIAGATLDFIASKVKCNCLFATHYHKLCQTTQPNVSLFHMECLTLDSGEIQLTHKFKPGQYPHSQAMRVARIAGLPQAVLDEAEKVSSAFEETAKTHEGVPCHAG